MSRIIAWQNPPRDYRDEAYDITQELAAHPGKWALVRETETDLDPLADLLSCNPYLEVRVANRRDWKDREGFIKYQTADLYARATEEDA
ncbi:hypothetical protein Bra3105_06690 [Brachybacterium halotolerans subsp. kimchii]|uniref:hypothetical protein n=1 Tax=Brachybacterium halotolerans TaxID=2795215 RepID=UPI001E576C84|nr:hypothetical protein [Brachybacterium halotolerans]UEJ83994.1 hypothetical protein Bra3105_06690 [Brachybacterium halotolerans subsp. kimchii]